MKFNKATVLAGSRIRDGIAIRKQEMENDKLYEIQEKILEQWHADQPIIEERAAKLLERVQNGEPIDRKELDNLFQKEDGPRWGSIYLGLDKDSLDRIRRDILKGEDHLKKLQSEPSELTRFLEAVEDDKISDYAIKGAGFKARLADLVLLGLEQEKQDAKEQTA